MLNNVHKNISVIFQDNNHSGLDSIQFLYGPDFNQTKMSVLYWLSKLCEDK